MNSKKNLISVVIVTKDRKKDLVDCVDSFIKSSYKQIEIIVVDNGSNPPLLTWFPKRFKQVKLITNENNVGAAEGRNIGLERSTGEYILFSDDDAVAGKDMLKNLLAAFKMKKDAGIIQPLVYDKQKKNLLQGAGHDINLVTGRITAWGVREVDKGQYAGLRKIPLSGCVWMVKRTVFNKVDNYDSEYFIPYEDSDFSYRVSKAGFGIYCYSEAKTWHQGPKKTYVHPWVEWLGITSPERAYRVARNKMIYMRKHSPFPYNIFFFLVLLPLYVLAHSTIILATGKFNILTKYWLGISSGAFYSITYPVRKTVKTFYSKLDENLYPLKMQLMARTDPTPLLIDPSVESILDLGSGPGKIMSLIKYRLKIKKAIGVELFKPYIDEAKKNKIYNEIITKDIRKINFKPNSFDLVIASHVLEHLPKKDAWKVLEKMEKIAKKQIIIATPIGDIYHPLEDGNLLQLHLCSFQPSEFEQKGYKIVKFGWKWLLGEHGLVHEVKSDILRKFLYTFNLMCIPIYYLFPFLCDFTFVAYKKYDQKK